MHGRTFTSLVRRSALSAAVLLLALAGRQALACGAPPPAVVDIDANSYYSDSHHSVIDPVRKARNEAATRPVDDFLGTVARSASAWQQHHDESDARCALGWLSSWADQKAML